MGFDEVYEGGGRIREGRWPPTFSFGSCLRWMGALKEKAAQIRKRPPPCSAGGKRLLRRRRH